MNEPIKLSDSLELEFYQTLIHSLQQQQTLVAHERSYHHLKASPSRRLIKRASSFGMMCPNKPYAFFHAVAEQLNDTLYKGLSYLDLIQIATHAIRGYVSSGSLKRYVARNKPISEEGLAPLVMDALSHALRITIIVVRSDVPVPNIYEGEQCIKPIFLGYDEATQHFYTLEKVREGTLWSTFK